MLYSFEISVNFLKITDRSRWMGVYKRNLVNNGKVI